MSHIRGAILASKRQTPGSGAERLGDVSPCEFQADQLTFKVNLIVWVSVETAASVAVTSTV